MEKENQNENLKFTFTAKIAGVEDLKFVPEISEWTKNAGTMLPIPEEKLTELFLSGHSVIVVNQLEEIVSHAAITFIYEDGSLEFGGLVTGDNFQGKGAGTLATKFLLEEISQLYPGSTIFALANNISEKIFKNLGASILPTNKVCEAVWDECKNCPKYKMPKQGEIFNCCDTAYDLTELKGGD